jgi:2-polyprenyl-3-methyl-5-hydroxy-6-metoxy-1,4-benzoquinol methylase
VQVAKSENRTASSNIQELSDDRSMWLSRKCDRVEVIAFVQGLTMRIASIDEATLDGACNFRGNAKPVCLVCGGRTRLKFLKADLKHFKCDCGFVFTWPRPSEVQLQEIYQRDGQEYWTTDVMMQFAFSPSKSRREIAFLRRFTSSGRLLDIGCSTGSFVKAAIDCGFKAEGVDICEPAVEAGRRLGLPLAVRDVLRDEMEREYDVVTLWATLEHLADPMSILRRASDLLRCGGLLVVSVPNYASLTQLLLHKWDRYVCDEHLNYFTPRVLAGVIESHGLHVAGRMTFGFNPLMIVKDLANRGRQSVNCQQMSRDEAQTLRLKESVLQYAQRAAEKMLDQISAGDALAMAAIKTTSHARGDVSGRAHRKSFIPEQSDFSSSSDAQFRACHCNDLDSKPPRRPFASEVI